MDGGVNKLGDDGGQLSSTHTCGCMAPRKEGLVWVVVVVGWVLVVVVVCLAELKWRHRRDQLPT